MKEVLENALNESVSPKGLYRAIIAEPDRAASLYSKILAFLAGSKPRDTQDLRQHFEELKRLLAAYHKAAGVGEAIFANLTPTAGRSVIAQRLAGTTTYSGTINYAALGSNTTAPNISDTQLGTEIYRQTLSSQTYINNIAYLSCFIAAGTATGTHKEAGLFIDGNGSANTGQLFSHVAIDITKGATNSLTLDIAVTVG